MVQRMSTRLALLKSENQSLTEIIALQRRLIAALQASNKTSLEHLEGAVDLITDAAEIVSEVNANE